MLLGLQNNGQPILSHAGDDPARSVAPPRAPSFSLLLVAFFEPALALSILFMVLDDFLRALGASSWGQSTMVFYQVRAPLGCPG